MRKWLALALLTFALTHSVNAEWVQVSETKEQQLFQHEGTDLQTSFIEFELDGFQMETVENENRFYQKITYPNEGQFIEDGMPELPRFSRLIAIPNEGNPQLEILYSDSIEMDNITAYPFQGLQSESSERNIAFQIKHDFYQKSNANFPEQIVEIGEPAIMRDLRVALLTINPIQYNPEKQSLTVYKNISVKVTTSGTDGKNIKQENSSLSRIFEPIYRSIVINYDTALERNSSYQTPSYLFIYPENSLVESTLQQLMTWKHQKGFIVHSATTTTTGTSASQIKNYIQNAYDTWENPPDYICLVGDAGGSFDVPTFFESWSGYGGPGDHPYTQLEGSDILADTIIGRLSFNTTTELQTIINKILTYEKTPYMGNTNWFNRTLLVGDPSSSGESCISTKKYVKELMMDNLPNMTYDEFYSGSFVTQMASSVNTGVGFFNYRGWLGMSGWDNTDTDALNNGYMLPFVVTITCGTGSFDGTYDAISERFLKAGSPSLPKGAIASVGTATTGTHTTFNNSVDAGIFYGIFNDGITTAGGSLVRGKLNLYQSFPTNPENKVNIFSYWNNLMGDPGLELWTSTPQIFSIVYDSQISLGSNFVTVQVKNSQNNPVSNAWVTLLKGTDEIFVSGYSDENGYVQLPISAATTGNINLVVTKHDFKPAIHTISITQNTQFVNVQDFLISDDNIGFSMGNGDGNLNPGERIELKIRLKNFGTSSVYGVSATLSTANENATLITATQNYGTITANNAVYSLSDFVLEISPSALDGEEIYLQLTISDNQGHLWTDTIVLEVMGANIQYQSYSVLNGKNGDIYPGQSAELAFTLRNNGDVPVQTVNGELHCSHEGITITDNSATYGNMTVGTEVSNTSSPFAVEISNQIISGSQIPFSIVLSGADGFEQTVYFTLEIGEVTVFAPLGPDAIGYYCYDQNDTNYDLAPVYNWIEIDPNYGGSGTVLAMSDSGDDGALQTVTLPFRLQFYGIRYNTLTICSNGFASPGETEEYSYMNWPVPGAQGPSPMIAPFWDDLRMGSGRVCYYSHPGNEYFVVQWSRLQNDYNGDEETFQMIFYNTFYYPSDTGNNDIKFQYKVVNNVDVGNYSSGYVSHGEYATVGIEDHSGTIGLQYTYSNIYPTAAAPLANETALLFTTNSPTILAPPVADFSDNEINVTLLPEQNQSSTIQISNTGEANLLYQISMNFIDSRILKDNRAEGGPDTYGYSWKDSNQPGGPEYDWIEISTTGTALSLDDDEGINVSLPFTFNYYGQDKNSVMISSNGYLTFGSTGSDWNNDPIPNSNQPNDIIAPYWDDLMPIGNDWGTVFYFADSPNNRFIIQYQAVSHWDSSSPRNPETFQVILYANGKIKFQYKITTSESDTTIGIENASGTDGLQVVHYDGSYLENNLAIVFQCVQEWATVIPASGTINGGQSQNIQVNVSAEEMELGYYACELIITTNAPNAANYIIPLSMEVVEAFLNAPQNVNISQNGSQVTIQWEAVTGAAGYKIYVANSPEETFNYLTTVSTNSFSHAVPQGKMFYKIVAIN